MADSFSANLRLRKQEVGQNDNTWGDLLNTTIDNLDAAIAGVVSIDWGVSSGGQVLTESEGVDDESRHAILVLKGAPASNVGCKFPAKTKVYGVRNKITNSASIRLQVNGDVGNELKIKPDFIGLVYSDGVNVFEMARQQSDVGATSAALRDDITSIRTKHTSIVDQVSSTSVALRDDITSLRARVSKVSVGAARTDADNDFGNFHLSNYRVSVETTTGDYTAASADSGRTLVFFTSAGGTSVNQTLTLAADLPVGWVLNVINANSSIGIVSIAAPTSVSVLNASAHRALNNYGSGATLQVIRQEGANSHAWVFFQGETQA